MILAGSSTGVVAIDGWEWALLGVSSCSVALYLKSFESEKPQKQKEI